VVSVYNIIGRTTSAAKRRTAVEMHSCRKQDEASSIFFFRRIDLQSTTLHSYCVRSLFVRALVCIAFLHTAFAFVTRSNPLSII